MKESLLEAKAASDDEYVDSEQGNGKCIECYCLRKQLKI